MYCHGEVQQLVNCCCSSLKSKLNFKMSEEHYLVSVLKDANDAAFAGVVNACLPHDIAALLRPGVDAALKNKTLQFCDQALRSALGVLRQLQEPLQQSVTVGTVTAQSTAFGGSLPPNVIREQRTQTVELNNNAKASRTVTMT